MYFLINYSRKHRKLLSLTEFVDSAAVSKAKLEAEIAALGSQIRTEIVILEAESLDSLRSSHSRYFSDIVNINIEG